MLTQPDTLAACQPVNYDSLPIVILLCILLDNDNWYQLPHE